MRRRPALNFAASLWDLSFFVPAVVASPARCTAKTRGDLLSGLAPKLAIADRLTIGEKYVDVRGNLFSYKIHLGSSNIQIMPDNRYLCIVRGARSKDKSADVHLPFAGDTLLSIILSKAFMLAADDKITDPTILSQLRR